MNEDVFSNNKGIYVPVLYGPSKKSLDKALKALEQARELTNRASVGSAIDNDYLCTILTPAWLYWLLKGALLPYLVNDRVEEIIKLKDENYMVKLRHQNWRRRILSDAKYRYRYQLDPQTDYIMHIVYNPETGVGYLRRMSKSRR